MYWCRHIILIIRRFYSNNALDSLKITPKDNASAIYAVKKYKNLPQIVTPNAYKLQLIDLLDKYPYLTQKDSVELLRLLNDLSEFHLHLGDRQSLALKSFLQHLTDGNNPNRMKILALKVYNKLVNDEPSFVTRSTIYLFISSNIDNESLELDDQLELLQVLNKAKEKTLNTDLKILEDEIQCLVVNLFLNGKFEFIDKHNSDFVKCIKFVHLFHKLFHSANDIVQYGLNKLIIHLDKHIDPLGKQPIIELIDMISHTFPSNYRNHLRKLCAKLVQYKKELSQQQFQQVVLH